MLSLSCQCKCGAILVTWMVLLLILHCCSEVGAWTLTVPVKYHFLTSGLNTLDTNLKIKYYNPGLYKTVSELVKGLRVHVFWVSQGNTAPPSMPKEVFQSPSSKCIMKILLIPTSFITLLQSSRDYLVVWSQTLHSVGVKWHCPQ